MAKRNDALSLIGAPAQTQATETPAPAKAKSARVVPIKAAAPEEKAEVARVMLYLSPKVAKKVKEIALHQDRKAHDVYLEALDAYLKDQGFGGLAAIAAR